MLSTVALVSSPAGAATVQASSDSTLRTSITNASTGDTIELTQDIVVTSAVAINKAITIDGNGYTVSVPVPGVNEAGANATSPSTFRVFTLSGSVSITLRDIKIKGGNAQGAGVYVSAGTTARIENATISNSRYQSSGGGGIYNGGTTYLVNSVVEKNSAMYGGGFLNPRGNSMYVRNSVFANNRSESSAGGGGAAENQGVLYINNSTFANNTSTEIGGAINNYGGTLYISDSSFTGNVAYGSYVGGALGVNGGSARVVSSLFAYNYSRSAGTVSSPTGFSLDDVGLTGRTPSGSGVTLLYSVYHATLTNATKTNSTLYTGAADGSDNSLFTGGVLDKITDGSGNRIGTASVFQPFLVRQNNVLAPALKPSSDALGEGTPVRFNETSGATSYYDRLAGSPSWVSTVGSATSADLVSLDQYGETRNATTPAAGAVERQLSNLVSLKSVQVADGSVSGASIFGEVYPTGSEVTVTALPNAGKTFSSFSVTVGGSTSTVATNPYVITLNASTVIQPSFASASSGYYSVTYAANQASCGTTPAFDGSTSVKTIASNSGSTALLREGYVFAGWNTEPNASGTSYQAGDTYSTVANLSLYAKWNVDPTAVNVCSQGSASPTPTPTSSASATPTPTSSSSVSPTPTATNSASATPTPTKSSKSTSKSGSSSQNIEEVAPVTIMPSTKPSNNVVDSIVPSPEPTDSIYLAINNSPMNENPFTKPFQLLLAILLMFLIFGFKKRRRKKPNT